MFVANPYKFTRTTLDCITAGSILSSKEEVERHLPETHSKKDNGKI